jgi:hypothetical protein
MTGKGLIIIFPHISQHTGTTKIARKIRRLLSSSKALDAASFTSKVYTPELEAFLLKADGKYDTITGLIAKRARQLNVKINTNFAKKVSPVYADIVDTAVGAGSFGTLVAAVKAAGLVDTLKGPGPFTVLAPSGKHQNALDWLPSWWRIRGYIFFYSSKNSPPSRLLAALNRAPALTSLPISLYIFDRI